MLGSRYSNSAVDQPETDQQNCRDGHCERAALRPDRKDVRGVETAEGAHSDTSQRLTSSEAADVLKLG